MFFRLKKRTNLFLTQCSLVKTCGLHGDGKSEIQIAEITQNKSHRLEFLTNDTQC